MVDQPKPNEFLSRKNEEEISDFLGRPTTSWFKAGLEVWERVIEGHLANRAQACEAVTTANLNALGRLSDSNLVDKVYS